MIARGVTAEQLESAARSIGVEVRNCRPQGKGFAFVIRPAACTKPAREHGKYYRRGFHNDRTVVAVCWHGHREFFRALFKAVPQAKIQTRATRDREFKWYTAENFESVFWSTDTNIGSAYRPMLYSEACFCSTAKRRIA